MNHGFAVDAKTLPDGRGDPCLALRRLELRPQDQGKAGLFVQHHPEASPGPQDSHYLFRRFVNLIRECKGEPAIAER